MPFLVVHKCNIGDAEPQEYAVIDSVNAHGKHEYTTLLCEKCRERLVVMADEAFKRTQPLTSIPGFIVPSSRV